MIAERNRNRNRGLGMRAVTWILRGAAIAALAGGCAKEPTPTRPPSAGKPAATAPAPRTQTEPLPSGHPPATPTEPVLPPGHPVVPGFTTASAATKPAAAPAETVPVPPGTKTALEGITLTVPEGWRMQPAKTDSKLPPDMAPKAVFTLTTGESDKEPVMVRVTHFPAMRDMPNMVEENLKRWYESFTQADGRPTSETAVVETFEAGPCRITFAAVRGTVGPQIDQGMIAAIIEHPKGPFFVKAMGPAAGVQRWKPSIVAYLKSAQAGE